MQTAKRLIRLSEYPGWSVFAGHTGNLLVLSGSGSSLLLLPIFITNFVYTTSLRNIQYWGVIRFICRFNDPRTGRTDFDSGNRLPVMNSQSRVLIAKLPSIAVAAINLARVIQIAWLLFNQMTVNRNKNGILAVSEFQAKRSDNTQLD